MSRIIECFGLGETNPTCSEQVHHQLAPSNLIMNIFRYLFP